LYSMFSESVFIWNDQSPSDELILTHLSFLSTCSFEAEPG